MSNISQSENIIIIRQSFLKINNTSSYFRPFVGVISGSISVRKYVKETTRKAIFVQRLHQREIFGNSCHNILPWFIARKNEISQLIVKCAENKHNNYFLLKLCVKYLRFWIFFALKFNNLLSFQAVKIRFVFFKH